LELESVKDRLSESSVEVQSNIEERLVLNKSLDELKVNHQRLRQDKEVTGRDFTKQVNLFSPPIGL